MWAPNYGGSVTQRQLFVAKGGSGTRGAWPGFFKRMHNSGCYWNCPDFGMTLQARNTTHLWAVWGLRDCRFATPG